jgi:hypothetical protein
MLDYEKLGSSTPEKKGGSKYLNKILGVVALSSLIVYSALNTPYHEVLNTKVTLEKGGTLSEEIVDLILEHDNQNGTNYMSKITTQEMYNETNRADTENQQKHFKERERLVSKPGDAFNVKIKSSFNDKNADLDIQPVETNSQVVDNIN